MESLKDRLIKLKQKRAKSVLENRKAVYDEASQLKSTLEEKEKREKLLDAEQTDNIKESTFKKKIKDNSGKDAIDLSSLSYTTEEDEKWNQKQKKRKEHFSTHNSKNGELQNYKQLAERTYAKNVCHLKEGGKMKSIEDYQKEKELYEKFEKQGLTPEQIRSKLTSKDKLKNYVGDVKAWESQVSNKRKKVEENGEDGAIHEKNRQFNNKLKRYYDRKN